MNLNNLPDDFPKVTPCWFCNKNIQNHSGAWRTEDSKVATKRDHIIRLSCFRHFPDNDIIYRWRKENDEWLLSSIIINYKHLIIHAIISAPPQSKYFKDGDCILFERNNNDIIKLTNLPQYWIFLYPLIKINQKLTTYSVMS